jgi:hypothetical protein
MSPCIRAEAQLEVVDMMCGPLIAPELVLRKIKSPQEARNAAEGTYLKVRRSNRTGSVAAQTERVIRSWDAANSSRAGGSESALM